jgi:ribonucleoside-triphosphate reductase
MSIKALQDYTYTSKYARFKSSENRRETYYEATDRVRDMHISRFPKLEKEITDAFEVAKTKRVLGSQRALQFGGTPILKKNARIYNCIASYCDRPRFFQECFWLLLCGCGTGFSVQKHHIAKLPNFHLLNLNKKKTFVIPDTIEGWSDALGILIASFIPHAEFEEWAGYDVEFDYSEIRPEGSELASGVGKAPGPEPLRRSLDVIKNLLKDRIALGYSRLRPIDCYDIIMHASDAVLSGGVRRSATLCMFSHDDEEMVNAKTGNWFAENPQRARSNNSAVLLRDKVTKEEFFSLVEKNKQFGEPGFIWTSNLEALYNPCVEIGLYAYDEKGNSGWQACNLCEINGKKIKTKEDFAIAAVAAAIIGTLQASYTNLEYLGPISKKIIEKEALLGVSITGMMDNPEIIFNPKIQQEMAELIVKTNKEFAEKIGINPAARCTCVKPAGTTSCVLGTASGIHPHHAKRYFRRIQGNWMEKPLQHFKKFNPMAVEKSVWSANGTDEIISFCIEVPKGAKTKNELSAVTLLEHVLLTQNNWVHYGKNPELCSQPWLTHNVSNTISICSDEWNEVANFIYENRQHFAGIALLSQSGDLDYPQAPMCTVYNSREIVQQFGEGSLFASGLIVDGLRAFDDNLWSACEAVLGLGKPILNPNLLNEWEELKNEKFELQMAWVNKLWNACKAALGLRRHTSNTNSLNESMELKNKKFELKIDWIRRAKQFAERYFEGDYKKMTYCLKCVHNWKLWQDLTRSYVDVDYSQMFENEDNTKVQQEWACSGGQCELK